MRRWIRSVILAAVTVSLTCFLPATTYAATTAISSVSIRVGTDLNAGDEIPSNIDVINGTMDVQSGTYVTSNSEKYEIRDAEWTSSNISDGQAGVGEELKLKVYLSATGYYSGDRECIFRGGYTKNNVSVKGGTYVSSKVVDSGDGLEITVKLNGIKGTYHAPDNAYWSGSGYGKAIWEIDSENRNLSSGYYDVYLYRGNSVVKKLTEYRGTTYDFYPYMTKKGDYSFKVRTVPYTESEKKYGEKSDWIESDGFYLDERYVSDGRGQTDDNGVSSSNSQVGWILNNGDWYYKYPDGTYQKNAWLKVNGKWYLFDSNGKMLTGWQNKNGQTYYLQSNGDMFKGWIKGGDKWYFMNPTVGDLEGAMCKGWITIDGKIYYLDNTGAMLEGWSKVDGNWYYFYPGSGHRAANTYIDTFYVDSNGIWKK